MWISLAGAAPAVWRPSDAAFALGQVLPLPGAAPIAPGSSVSFGLLMVNGGFPTGRVVNLTTPAPTPPT